MSSCPLVTSAKHTPQASVFAELHERVILWVRQARAICASPALEHVHLATRYVGEGGTHVLVKVCGYKVVVSSKEQLCTTPTILDEALRIADLQPIVHSLRAVHGLHSYRGWKRADATGRKLAVPKCGLLASVAPVHIAHTQAVVGPFAVTRRPVELEVDLVDRVHTRRAIVDLRQPLLRAASTGP